MTTNLIRAIVFFLATASAIHAQNSFHDYFPMEKGTRWTYSGKVEWTHDTNKIGSGRKTITTEVEDSFEVGGVQIALLRGGPWDLAWWEPDKKASLHVVVRKENRYYTFYESDGELLRALRKGEWPADRMESEIWFEVPMGESEQFCGPEDQERVANHDYFYCWFVESEGKKALPALGIKKALPWFNLRYQTNPDHEIDTIVPGVGITHFVYSHHGTVSNVDVNLVAFHRGTKRGTPAKSKTLPTSR